MIRTKAHPRVGVIPPDDSLVPRGLPIVNAAVPSVAVIPLLQHRGPPARCLVRPGEYVREGMLIGKADGPLSANVHSSIPGQVVEVRPLELPDGVRSDAVVIELGGEFDRSGKPRVTRPWESLSRLDLLARIQAAGIVGLGGSLVPTHLKLATAPGAGVACCVGNGVDSEPSLCADDALMREKAAEIAEGLRICARLVGAQRLVMALGERSEDLAAPFERVFREKGTGCDIMVIPSRYPQGHEQLVLETVLGTPRTSSAARSGKVLNVATLFAVYEAVVLDKPLIERVLTVTGGAVAAPRNLKVRIGTNIAELFDECGGFVRPPARVVIGGPMRGTAVPSYDAPVTKGTAGLVAFSRAEARPRAQYPCIRCGSCVEACPWGLVPMRLHKLIEGQDHARAMEEGLDRCTECGCCAFACPSNIPLVMSLRAGKRAAGREGNA
jgi:electron transport complex protein RnfC